jgi:hypothetical protein
MATPRMDITSFVGKLLEQDDVDLLRGGHQGARSSRDGDRGLRPDRCRALRAVCLALFERQPVPRIRLVTWLMIPHATTSRAATIAATIYIGIAALLL